MGFYRKSFLLKKYHINSWNKKIAIRGMKGEIKNEKH